MSGDKDNFNIEDLRLPDGIAPPTSPAKVRAKPKKRRVCFIGVPCVWRDRLVGSKQTATFKLVLHLLHEAWRTGERTVPLSNVALAGKGVSPASKNRALAELQRLGLIEVERHSRKSPLVRLLLID